MLAKLIWKREANSKIITDTSQMDVLVQLLPIHTLHTVFKCIAGLLPALDHLAKLLAC